MSNEECFWKLKDSQILRYIEEQLGKYQENPKVHMVPNLYEECGYYAGTLISNKADGSKKPVCIMMDQILFRDENEFIFLEAFTHELFEWRFVERGEKYPHASAVKATHELLSQFNIRPEAYPLINSLFPRVGNLLEKFVDLRVRLAEKIFPGELKE